MTKHRLEMFSDGVFAIVITILILNIHLPENTSTQHLGEALKALFPDILAYVTSFILIGLYWIAHHTSFHHIHKVNGVLLWLNMLLLLFVSFMPFPASLLGKYPTEPVPLMIYGSKPCCVPNDMVHMLSSRTSNRTFSIKGLP